MYKKLVDYYNNIEYYKIKGLLFKGKMFKLKGVFSLEDLQGSEINVNILRNNSLVLNGNGFVKKSKGKKHIGLKIVKGYVYNNTVNCESFIGVTKDLKVTIEDVKNIDKSNYLHACSFKPILVKNGKNVVLKDLGGVSRKKKKRLGIGIYPDGSLLIIIIDIFCFGITLEKLQDIFYKEGVEDAINLDGGRSILVYYRGRRLTGGLCCKRRLNSLILFK